MSIEKYSLRISELRGRLQELAQEAMSRNGPVSQDFWTVQDELHKVLHNAQVWCRRNKVEFPF